MGKKLFQLRILGTILRWFVLSIFSIVATVLSYFIVPFVVSGKEEKNTLNKTWAWLQTYDNDLDGDNGWKYEHLLFLNPRNNKYDVIRRYFKRVFWLYRNPVSSLDTYLFGVSCDPSKKIAIYGDPSVSNRPEGVPGYCFITYDNFRCFMFYFIFPFGRTGRCLRIYLGWKLMRIAKKQDYTGKLPLVLNINPLMGYVVKKD